MIQSYERGEATQFPSRKVQNHDPVVNMQYGATRSGQGAESTTHQVCVATAALGTTSRLGAAGGWSFKEEVAWEDASQLGRFADNGKR